MARVTGQIDLAKHEAILDAAIAVLGERGVSASMDEIARRAGVSKQTVYNHYGCKADLVRIMTERRAHEITAPLDAAGAAENPGEALAAYARILLDAIFKTQGQGLFRTAIVHATDMPDVALAMWEAGPNASRRRLAAFLADETRRGRLACPDPREAAEFFAGMVIGSYQTAFLLGVPLDLDAARVERIATEAAARFLKAYAPD